MSIDRCCRCQLGRPPRGLLGLHDTIRGYVQAMATSLVVLRVVLSANCAIKIIFCGPAYLRIWHPYGIHPYGMSIYTSCPLGCQHGRMTGLSTTSAHPFTDRVANVVFLQRSIARSITWSRAERCLACLVDATPPYPRAASLETSHSSSVCLARHRLGLQD
jgi:hypothetical protein